MGKFRQLFILLVISLTSLTSCKAIQNAVTAKTPQLDKPFTCSFSMTSYDDLEISGKMLRFGTNLWEMEITAPETMAGLGITRNDNGMDLSLGDLEICIGQDKINNGAFAELIFKAIDSCAAIPEMNLEETENGLVYNGKVSECPFSLTFESDTMTLKEIVFPSIELNVQLSDFHLLTQDISQETTAPTETESTITVSS